MSTKSLLYYLGEDYLDLPPGPTWRCKACGALIRTGEPHDAREPYPHATLETLFAKEGDSN